MIDPQTIRIFRRRFSLDGMTDSEVTQWVEARMKSGATIDDYYNRRKNQKPITDDRRTNPLRLVSKLNSTEKGKIT